MTLSEFLLARIAEDEATAERWPAAPDYGFGPDGKLWMDSRGHPIWAPRERVLAECAAKRRIAELHKPARDESWLGTYEYGTACLVCVDFHADVDCCNQPYPCPTLKAVAASYADHPDYDSRWAL
jgi:uncharacterized protein DUF6221